MKVKNTSLIILAAVMTGLLQSGCFGPQGLLFTRVKKPHALPANRRECPVATKQCYVSLTRLKEPVTRMNLSVMWSDKAVKEAADAAGITEIYYTDLETLSILLGTYKRNRVIFYGK